MHTLVIFFGSPGCPSTAIKNKSRLAITRTFIIFKFPGQTASDMSNKSFDSLCVFSKELAKWPVRILDPSCRRGWPTHPSVSSRYFLQSRCRRDAAVHSLNLNEHRHEHRHVNVCFTLLASTDS